MGLFSRKSSKVSVDGSSIASRNSQILQSPSSARTPGANGASFGGGGPQMPTIPMPRPPDPSVDPTAYLRSIHAVRERTRPVVEKAKRNQLKHFDVDMTKFGETAGYTVSIIKVRPRTRGDASTNGAARLRPRLSRDSAARPLATL